MKRGLQIALGVGVLIALVMAGLFALRPLTAGPSDTRATLEGLRSNVDTSKFARALQPREFTFPQDHGPHNDFQTEWWYYTGNLFDKDGRHFGYQLTFFRRAIVPPDQHAQIQARPSDFAFDQIYFAHFAVTDSVADEHVSFEKYSRGAAGLAGATSPPFRVFIEDWAAATTMGVGGAEAVHLNAKSGDYAIELDLATTKPAALHGERGLSRKSEAPGNASYYYSFTRMQTKGRVTTKGGAFDVSGDSWLDREWSTSALDNDTAGWDWFSLQLDDKREIMFYQLRLKDGTSSPVSGGTLVDANGNTMQLARDDVQIQVLDRWSSPDSGATYPGKWRFIVPKYGLDLEITPRVKDQEMKLSQRYWEGAVSFNGVSQGKPISGVGYVELTGYGEANQPNDRGGS